jgi:hypothetical protein
MHRLATLYLQFYLLLFWGQLCSLGVLLSWFPSMVDLWQPLKWTGDVLPGKAGVPLSLADASSVANGMLSFRNCTTMASVGCIISLSMCIAMVMFISMHTVLILKGQTTLEAQLFG